MRDSERHPHRGQIEAPPLPTGSATLTNTSGITRVSRNTAEAIRRGAPTLQLIELCE
jgi:hypothetical protein